MCKKRCNDKSPKPENTRSSKSPVRMNPRIFPQIQKQKCTRIMNLKRIRWDWGSPNESASTPLLWDPAWTLPFEGADAATPPSLKMTRGKKAPPCCTYGCGPARSPCCVGRHRPNQKRQRRPSPRSHRRTHVVDVDSYARWRSARNLVHCMLLR